MKFNWGHGVTIGFALFVVYILSFVYRSYNQNIDLVAEVYYAQEVAFQDRIDETANAEQFKEDLLVTRTDGYIEFTFPQAVTSSIKSGEIHFFRPSDKAMDIKLPLELNDSGMVRVPTQILSQGRYQVKFSWNANDKAFYLSKDVVI